MAEKNYLRENYRFNRVIVQNPRMFVPNSLADFYKKRNGNFRLQKNPPYFNNKGYYQNKNM